MIRHVVFCLLVVGIVGVGVSAETPLTYETSYQNASYESAKNELEVMKASVKHPQGALLYNLGNVYYRLGKVGEAIYYYEKALKKRPRDTDVKDNLRLAQAMRIDKPLEGTEDRSKRFSITYFTFNEWTLALVLLFTVGQCLGFVYFRYHYKKELIKNILMVGGGGCS